MSISLSNWLRIAILYVPISYCAQADDGGMTRIRLFGERTKLENLGENNFFLILRARDVATGFATGLEQGLQQHLMSVPQSLQVSGATNEQIRNPRKKPHPLENLSKIPIPEHLLFPKP